MDFFLLHPRIQKTHIRYIISKKSDNFVDLTTYEYVSGIFQVCTSLLPISGFVLDEKFQRNASKFARPGHSLEEKTK